jgi:hypothetical protein
MARDKASLDIFWLKDDSLDNLDDLPPPDVLQQEIIEHLEAAPGNHAPPDTKPLPFSVGAFCCPQRQCWRGFQQDALARPVVSGAFSCPARPRFLSILRLSFG